MPHMRQPGAGEGWIDIFAPDMYWMEIYPGGRQNFDVQSPALPTVAPGDVATAEVCFRLPDGWSVCTLANDVFATDYAGMGYPQIPANAPEFVPPIAADVTRIPETVVVSSHPSEVVPEDEVPIHGEGGWVAGAIDLYENYTNWQSTPIYNFGGPGVGGGTSIPSPVTPGASCGCNSNPCVCGTINGRPALVDPRTGKRCYRRRRRVMLTEGDFNTLLRIATLPNNANVRTALAKAIGRR